MFWKRAAIVFPAVTAGAVLADMRCGENLIDEGQLPYEVLERCGEPEARSERPQFLAPGVVIWVEEWLYEFGSNRFRRLLVFRAGRLSRIELRPKPEPSS